MAFPAQGLILAILIGIALGVCLGVSLLMTIQCSRRRSEVRLKRYRKSMMMLSSRSEFDAGPDVRPSTITQHYHHQHHQQHHHHHQMTSASVPASVSSHPTLSSAVDTELDLGYSSAYGNGCCVAASTSFVDRCPFPLPVLDCACSDGHFRQQRAENFDDARQIESNAKCSNHPDSSSFKDAATDRLLRMPDTILLPVADSAVNYGLDDTGTSLRTVDVCRSCCTDSRIT